MYDTIQIMEQIIAAKPDLHPAPDRFHTLQQPQLA